MKQEYENYLLQEYKNSRLNPIKISVGKYDFIVPYAYANPTENCENFEKALFSKYLNSQSQEIAKYSDNGYRRIPTLRFADRIIVTPYRLRNLEPIEAQIKIADEIYKRYTKAIRLTMCLNQAQPEKKRHVLVDCESVKNADAEYNEYLLNKFQDKTICSAAKLEKFIKNENAKSTGFLHFLPLSAIQRMSRKYIKRLEQIKRIWNKNRNKIQLAFGATTIAGLLTLGTYKSATFKDKNKNTTEASIAPTKIMKNMSRAIVEYSTSQTGAAAHSTKTKTGFDALNKNVQNFLDSRGLGKKQLTEVQRHNLNIFLKTEKEFNLFVAFAENFHASTYDDGKGFLTIGYGCTNYLDEKGLPLEKTGSGGKKSVYVQNGQTTTEMQGMQQVDRMSKFFILPKILELVKVKLNEKQMLTTKNFAFVTANRFDDSKFLEALNAQKSNNYLSQCMAIWNVDGGISKRLFVAHLVLNGHLKPADIQSFKPSSCYNLTLEQCLKCKTNIDGSVKMKKTPVITTEIVKGRKKKVKRYKIRPDYKMKNGMPQFTEDENAIAAALETLRAKPNEQRVADIVPQYYYAPDFFKQKSAATENYVAKAVKLNKNARDC